MKDLPVQNEVRLTWVQMVPNDLLQVRQEFNWRPEFIMHVKSSLKLIDKIANFERFENVYKIKKISHLNRLIGKLSFEPSKP